MMEETKGSAQRAHCLRPRCNLYTPDLVYISGGCGLLFARCSQLGRIPQRANNSELFFTQCSQLLQNVSQWDTFRSKRTTVHIHPKHRLHWSSLQGTCNPLKMASGCQTKSGQFNEYNKKLLTMPLSICWLSFTRL